MVKSPAATELPFCGAKQAAVTVTVTQSVTSGPKPCLRRANSLEYRPNRRL